MLPLAYFRHLKYNIVVVLAHESIVEKVLFRLIKKHISGPTMQSAIDKAKYLNSKSIPVSINFLSQEPQEKAKANYITTTYMQLIREIARLGVTASVHLRFTQLGSNIDAQYAASNLESLLALSRKYGVFVWCELSNPLVEFSMLNQIKDAKGLGLAICSIEDALAYSAKHKPLRELKVMCKTAHLQTADKKQDEIKEKDHTSSLDAIAKASKNLVLLSPKDEQVNKLLKKNPKYRKSLILEFQLGYNEKKLVKMLKKGNRLSVYVPFGKDWASYATSAVPHRAMRLLASNLLNEKKGA